MDLPTWNLYWTHAIKNIKRAVNERQCSVQKIKNNKRWNLKNMTNSLPEFLIPSDHIPENLVTFCWSLFEQSVASSMYFMELDGCIHCDYVISGPNYEISIFASTYFEENSTITGTFFLNIIKSNSSSWWTICIEEILHFLWS